MLSKTFSTADCASVRAQRSIGVGKVLVTWQIFIDSFFVTYISYSAESRRHNATRDPNEFKDARILDSLVFPHVDFLLSEITTKDKFREREMMARNTKFMAGAHLSWDQFLFFFFINWMSTKYLPGTTRSKKVSLHSSNSGNPYFTFTSTGRKQW